MNECERHRTLILMRHLKILIITILMNKSGNRFRVEVKQEQCNFIQDTGIRNAISLIRMRLERESKRNAERSMRKY